MLLLFLVRLVAIRVEIIVLERLQLMCILYGRVRNHALEGPLSRAVSCTVSMHGD